MRAGRSSDSGQELAKKMGMGDVFPWKTDEEVVELEFKSIGLSYKELKEEKIAGAYYMEKKYGMDGYEVKGFSTPSKKIEIYSETFEKAGFDPLPTYREPDQSPLGDPKMFQRYPLDSDDRGPDPLLYPCPAPKYQRSEGEES